MMMNSLSHPQMAGITEDASKETASRAVASDDARHMASTNKKTAASLWIIACLLVAALLLIAGVSALGMPSIVPEFLLAGAACLAIGTTILGLAKSRSTALDRYDVVDPKVAKLEGKIEALEDLRWQARDNADHLQALLDGQSDIIVRRDQAGRVNFANRAFCKRFEMELARAIGRPFHPKVLESVPATDRNKGAGNLPTWAAPVIERYRTDIGLRWIEWTHQTIPGEPGEPAAVQSIGRDITDQRRHERTLAAARDEALTADRAKSRFLASMSHEIRTPMNGILGMASLLEETHQSPEQKTYTQAVRKSAETLLALIDEILDFSRIEAGHLELTEAPVDVAMCVQGVVELLAPRAYQKQLQLAWSIMPGLPRTFIGDETRLRQIMLNLIGNAVKFTETGGVSVWVGSEAVDAEHDEVKIVVRDTGPGLSDEGRQRIFAEFERVLPNGTTQHESGTGLGLAIARRLAISMGGDISVASRHGDGATFTLSICLPHASNQLPGYGAPERIDDKARHVVIVSSKRIERRTIANFLRAHNIVVTELNAPDDLINKPGKAEPAAVDIVLFDSNACPSNAREALNSVSATSGQIKAGVIVDMGDRAEIDRFRRNGIDQFLVRPIRPVTVLALLAGRLEKPSAGTSATEATVVGLEPAVKPATRLENLSKRILVAEDNQINALLTRTILSRLGCEPIVVTNGREAVDAIADSLSDETAAFDAVLMDLHMPILDGLGATAEIRSLCAKAGAKVPAIIAVTANAFQEDRDRCLAAGMDDYLSKPFDPEDLKKVLERVSGFNDILD
jgi:PAS domain S-box-containing protein